MRPTRAADLRWPAAIAAVVAGAAILRLWGFHHGLPYVYNADENAHFVPRAIGMFGHSYDPAYFINPPGLTYLLHALFWVRWGGAGVQHVYASDPGAVFGLARAAVALLGAAGVGLLGWAAVRLLAERTAALLAAAALAVAFLPVHYAHYALNDVAALAPECLALAAIGGVLRHGRDRDHALAGLAIGLAVATKYTSGIVVLCLLAAGPRPRGLALAAGAALVGFLALNPYALLHFGAFWDGLSQQSSASNDTAGKLGLAQSSGLVYYLRTLPWGLGWVPALAALAGVARLWRHERRVALVLAPAPVVFLVFMGLQGRFFARWMLPAYPLLCVLAGAGATWVVSLLAARLPRSRARLLPALALAALIAQGLVLAVHNDRVLARPDTRQELREWMIAHVPQGARVVLEPISPEQWVMDPGRPSPVTGTGARWNKWHSSRARIAGQPRVTRIKLEDYERTLVPALVDAYVRTGYCWVIVGSIMQGRALVQPAAAPLAIAYYRSLERRSDVVWHRAPWRGRAIPFSFDDSYNSRPLAYTRPGPEITVRRLRGCR